jgi:hypothetical protein
MATARILRKAYRNTSTVQGPSQLILQGSITRIAEDENRKRALADLAQAKSKLMALEAQACLVDPNAMSTFLNGILRIVERAEARARCPELPDGMGLWDDVT